MKTKTMMVALATLLIGGLCFWACQEDSLFIPEPETQTSVIPDEYIVVFNDKVSDVPGLARQLADHYEGEIFYIYEHAIHGFAARLPAEAAEALQRHPQVKWVESDQLVSLAVREAPGGERDGSKSPVFPTIRSGGSYDVQEGPHWGLDRIDQRDPELDGLYHYYQTGKGVTVYMIGEGISPHQEFENDRLKEGFAPRGESAEDHSDNGWSTGLAAVVGGAASGVAKEVNLVPVRVIVPPVHRNILAGLDWIVKDYEKNSNGPAVTFATFYSGSSNALDKAVKDVIKAGITFVAVGLNSNDLDACGLMPSGIPGVITAGSVNENHEITSSPLVDCIDIFAPGTHIKSATNTGYNDFRIYNNHANMAAAHVAGVAALYLEYNNEARPEEVYDALMKASTKGMVKGNPTNNHLLYSLAWDEAFTPPPDDPDPPVADFTFEVNVLTVTFTDLSEEGDSDIIKWEWSFGDGAYSEGQNPIHFYKKDGTYEVTLIVTDENNATDTARKNVTVVAGDDGGGGNDPTIDEEQITVITSRAGPWYRVDIGWKVDDEDGDLQNVSLELLRHDIVLASKDIGISGFSASGTDELRSRTEADSVRITVTDKKGNSGSYTQSVEF